MRRISYRFMCVKLGFVFVILSEAKDLKPKYKMRETRFFAYRLRMTIGRARRPTTTTGRRLGAPYPLPLRGSTPSQCEGDVAKRQRETAAVSGWHAVRRDGGRETEKSLPQSNAVHLTALPSRGTRFCLRLGAPNKIDRFAHKWSLCPPPAAVTFIARQRGQKRREQAPALP